MENQKKEMLGIRIGMLKLSGACVKTINGKTATKRCLIVPIDDNPCFFLGEKDCYLNLVAIGSTNSQYGDTHFVIGDMPRELRESMTQEQRNALPILGNIKPIERQATPQMQVGSMGSDSFADEDDLPF